jgi:hypothetical protein
MRRKAMMSAYCSGFNEPGAPRGIWVVRIVRNWLRFRCAAARLGPVSAGAETPWGFAP